MFHVLQREIHFKNEDGTSRILLMKNSVINGTLTVEALCLERNVSRIVVRYITSDIFFVVIIKANIQLHHP